MRGEIENRHGRWTRLKAFGAVLVAAFVVTLALVVGNRLSEEALGVLAGVVCGVGAAIPTSLIILFVSRRHGDASGAERLRVGHRDSDYAPRQPYPPVVVVSPGSTHQPSRAAWNALPSSLSEPRERTFRIVGGAAVDREGVRYGDERCA